MTELSNIEIIQLPVTCYRTEQNVSIKLNQIPINHTVVKIDYTLTKLSPLCYAIHADDYIAKISPDPYQELLNMVNKIEQIKCNVKVLIDENTGKINRIINLNDVFLNWQNYKNELLAQYNFIRSEDAKNNFNTFISIFDEQFRSERQLIEGLEKQLFFMVFFDQYLVGNKTTFEKLDVVNFYSLLFEGVSTPLQVTEKIIKESPEIVVLQKSGQPITESINLSEIERQYNEKYQPAIDYHFTSYDARYGAQLGLNTLHNSLEHAEIIMRELVKNNVELEVLCKVRRIS